MRKFIVVALSSAMMISMSACGGGQQPASATSSSTVDSTEGVSNESSQTVEQSEDYAEITEENYRDYPATDESCFSYNSYEDGSGVYITYCNCDDPVVIVPETIKDKKVVAIAGSAFYGKNEMVALKLPDSVEYIGDYCFSDCTKLKYVDLGTGLKSYGQVMFSDCDVLEKIYIPDGADANASLALYCENLKDVYVPASLTVVDGLFWSEDCPDAVVHTPSGSAAEQWAKDNGITVINDYDDYE